MSRPQQGFTLIELVVAVVLMSIVALILVQFMGTAVTRSGMPLVMVADNYEVLEVVDILNAEYREQLMNDQAGFSLPAFKNGLDSRGHPDVSVGSDYVDFDANGDETVPGGETRFLKVTVAKGRTAVTVLFTGR